MTKQQVDRIMGEHDGCLFVGLSGVHYYYDHCAVTITFGLPLGESENRVVDVAFSGAR